MRRSNKVASRRAGFARDLDRGFEIRRHARLRTGLDQILDVVLEDEKIRLTVAGDANE